ncbi:steroid 17-alpha-hydroxylase/17,20 lyase [Hydra vulgaris]|uniref:Steroid 17-alpha-hydroxylase/17,20 lyase n=1 Tax=Hydra vulgaris TaxID=6087 RepID=A0ABM4CXL1_HYDVU
MFLFVVFEIVFGLIIPVLLYVIVVYIYHIWECQKYPPGPFPLPVIGNYNLLANDPVKALCDLETIYGDVFSLSLGNVRVVVVSGHESIYNVLVGDGSNFSGRPREYSSLLFTGGFENLSHMDNNPLTKKIRKVFYSKLKTNGSILTHNENIVKHESELLHQRLLLNEGSVINLRYEIDLCIVNSICSIIFGNRLSDTCEVNEILKATRLLLKNLSNIEILHYLPWMRFFLLKKQNEISESRNICKFWIQTQLHKRKKSLKNENISDILLNLWDQQKQDLNEEQYRMILVELVMAGSETTAATITWLIVYLLHWPHYQNILYKEIKNISGDQYPTFNDIKSMPIMQATILETLRLSSVVPLSLSHKAVNNAKINEFTIPKDTIIITNLWGIHHKEKYWEKPFEFNPMRWLDKNGELSTAKRLGYFPFSAGPRGCIGESFARMQMFIICSRLIKDFYFELPQSGETPKLDGDIGITLTPLPYNAVAKQRT